MRIPAQVFYYSLLAGGCGIVALAAAKWGPSEEEKIKAVVSLIILRN